MTIIRRLGIDFAYCFLGLPLAVVSFGILVPFFAASIGTLVVFVGIPLLALTLLIARGFADLERVRLEHLTGRVLPRPRYRPAPEGAGWFRRVTTPIRQGQGWLDLLYAVINLPIAIITFVFPVVWWALTLGGLTYWIWGRFIPYGPDQHDIVLEKLMGADTEHNRVIFYTFIGVFGLLTVYAVQRGMAALHGAFAQAMLTRLAQLQGRIEDLTTSRAAAVSAEATALRKLERDIHDGPQQRLIRLAMELSRAQKQLRDDPAAASATLDDALGQARETLDELRALSRGIAPPILTDRGLPAALTTLASRSTVPVELAADVPGRLAPAIENALYFAAAEALSNVAKHSGATSAQITLTRRDGKIYLMVTDDGAGGAHIAKGHGIAGLADRLSAIDGQLAVDSPAGGPTVVIAEVPEAS
ncbi:sensor histidine kinase [Hamadaea tsunoensis]|uniref:sensor histidine kinase n=1 Tax=Hamadaea tsunoensis TaxID=53368 RepID=UPI000553F757|nr:sensor histidine kinase [Hamadaea tsunoensis]